MRTIILVPTYNERRNIQRIIPEIFSIVPQAEVMVIDDNSPDGTAIEVQKLRDQYPQLALLNRKQKEGLGAAYKDALQRVVMNPELQTIVTMDADGSHDVSYLPELLEMRKDFQLVVGSRYAKNGGVQNWELWRKYLSKMGNIYAKHLSGLQINDMTAGFMAIDVELVRLIQFHKLSAAGYAFLMQLKFECIHHLSASSFEVPIIFKSRREGESKISQQIIWEGLRTPLMLLNARLRNVKKDYATLRDL